MLVSVILPVYNAASHIRASVNSILAQTYTAFELLIIDDGSTDATPELLKEFAALDQRVRVITIAHAGVTAAMNTGLKEAKGDYIARMDADDEMLPSRLEKQKTFLDAHSDIGVVSSLVKHGGDATTQEGYATHIEWINTLISHEQIFLNRFIDSPVCNPSVMFRRTLVERFGNCRQGDFPEDYELWLRYLDNGVRFAKIPEVLLIWNDPLTRLTRNDTRYSAEAFSRIKAGYLAEFINEHIHGRKLWLCGAGRITRRKSDFLSHNGITIGGYIDVDPKKIGKQYNGYLVISLEMLGDKHENYIVSYVGNRGAREAIRLNLMERGFEEGKDFVMAG